MLIIMPLPRTLLLFCFPVLLFPFLLKGQPYRHQPLHSQGPVPADFFPDLSAPATNDKALGGHTDRKILEDYTLMSNHHIYQFMVNGYVLYGTPLNRYLEKIGDRLLANDPELRSRLRFYVVESSEVGAFTYSNGIICVNMGLLANVKNEAQLAFVLSHEIAHYKKGHSFSTYYRHKKIGKKSRKMLKTGDLDVKAITTRFSREKEIEADMIGYDIFRESGYRLSEAASLFDVLARWEFPFDSVPIRKEFFEGKYLKIPLKYFIDTIVNTHREDTSTNDEYETHPAIPKRKQTMLDYTKDKAGQGELFLVSEAEFTEVRTVARYELSRIYLWEQEHMRSVYNTYLLLLHNPDDPYLNACFVKALYFIQKNVNGYRKSEVTESKRRSRGQVSRINHLLRNLRKDELNVLCLRLAWDTHRRFPENTEIFAFTSQITRSFKGSTASELSYFHKISDYNDSLISTFYQVTDLENIETRQKQNRGKRSNKVKVAVRGTFAKYAMPDYIEEEEFVTTFNSLVASEEVVEREHDDDDEEKSETRRARASQKKPKPAGSEQALNSLIIADLTDIKLDERKKDPVMYMAMKRHKGNLVKSIRSCAGMNNIDVKMFIPEELDKNDSVAFYERNCIKKYFDERGAYTEWKEYYGVNYEELVKIAERNNTRYVGVMFNAGVIMKKSLGTDLLVFTFGTMYYPPLAIYLAYRIFAPEKNSFLGFMVIDVTTGKQVYEYSQFYSTDSHTDLIKAELYYIFHELKNQ